jgi:hypothetical protein
MLESLDSSSNEVTNPNNNLLTAFQQHVAALIGPQALRGPTPAQQALQQDRFQNPSASTNPSRLSLGSRGAQVAQLQSQLQAQGYYRGAIDGNFGKATQSAVKNFQRSNGIRPSGVVGTRTWATAHGDAYQAPTRAARTPRTPAATGAGSAQTRTPWYSQFAGGHGYTPSGTACFWAARSMAAAGGAHVPRGLGNGTQIATRLDNNGDVSVNAAKAKQATAYINSELDAGRPVVVGVAHAGPSHNGGLADHFVTITGRGTDTNGNTYYTFNDPGTKSAALGADTRAQNRFYVDSQTGGLYRNGTGTRGVVNMNYNVTWVGKSAESQ